MPKRKKVVKSKSEDKALLVLEGCVYLETHKNGKITKDPIDGEVVLKLLVQIIEQGIRLLDKD